MQIDFDAIKHEYFVEGRRYPSVTQIIAGCGLIEGMEWFTDDARERGKNIHLATQYYDEGDLDESTIDPAYLPYLEAYKKFSRECFPKYTHIEKRLYNALYGYAGTCDRVGFLLGRNVIIDIKSGSPARWHGLQMWAYRACLPQETPFTCFGLYLRDNGTYKLEDYKNKNDIQIFRAACLVYKFKKGEL
jgi:hypothetical protein